jgi:hypothetical protein
VAWASTFFLDSMGENWNVIVGFGEIVIDMGKFSTITPR